MRDYIQDILDRNGGNEEELPLTRQELIKLLDGIESEVEKLDDDTSGLETELKNLCERLNILREQINAMQVYV